MSSALAEACWLRRWLPPMLRQAKLPRCSIRATRWPNTCCAAGCRPCCSNSAKATASSQVAMKLLLKARSEALMRTEFSRGQPATGALSGTLAYFSGELARAMRQSSVSACRRQSLKGVTRFGASRTSSGAQGFQRGGSFSAQP
ncbi:hypothetical protein D9M71_663540 [compost metagenome]